MADYVLLLDQTAPYLNAQFCEIPQGVQERISQAGMGEKTETQYDGIEVFEFTYSEAEDKYLSDAEAKEVEEGEGIRKGKGIRNKIKTEHYYIWDKLSRLEREYKVAKYDFENCPGFREKVTTEKLVETITPYLEKEFSDLPQQIKIHIALIDKNHRLWNGISPQQRKQHVEDFVTKKNHPNEISKFVDMRLELEAIPEYILYWQHLNPNRIASEQIIIDNKIKEIRKREIELRRLFGYSESNKKQEFSQLESLPRKNSGRPKSVENKVTILKQIIESLTEDESINPIELPGSAGNLQEACAQISRLKLKKNLFSTSPTTFKNWLKATGYGFGSGRTQTKERKYWTKLCDKNIEKINPGIFTEVSN